MFVYGPKKKWLIVPRSNISDLHLDVETIRSKQLGLIDFIQHQNFEEKGKPFHGRFKQKKIIFRFTNNLMII